MTKYFLTKLPMLLLGGLIFFVTSSPAFAQANVTIVNGDDPGVGFNDPTPATPVGGNTGTTVGEQRLIAFQTAANIYSALLVSSPTITVRATWQDLSNGCTTSSGTLGSAGNNGNIWRNFSGSVPNFWYGNALANALSGIDRNGVGTHEINAQFNLKVGAPGCLDNLHWYYGLDGNEGSTGVDLVAVVLHEFAHGLGFQTFTSSTTGQQAGNAQAGFFPSIADQYLLDHTANKSWAEMTTDAERQASAINTGNLVWSGPQVTADSGLLTNGKDAHGHPLMFTPNPVRAGSSVSHWDSLATPHQLMEPNIQRSLTHSVTVPEDLTLSFLRDIGWATSFAPPPPPPPAPANDNFASAQTITGCSGTVNGSNISATREAGEPAHWPASPGSTKSVWYQWQAAASQSVTINTTGSNYDTILAVYTGNGVSGLTLVANNDDIASGNTTSTVTFTANAGTIYRIAVDGFNNGGSGGDTGSIVLNWNQNCPVVGPTIFVEEGTNVVAALDSVTQVKGPFTVLTANNFSSDGRRRIIFFTTDLGLPTGNTSGLIVRANSTSLPIETAGPFNLIGGSYVIVRLDGLTPATYNLTVTLNGVSSTNAPTIQIIP